MTELNQLGPHFFVKVAAACFCGALIGLERQLRGKPAGVRTSILVCLGCSLFIHLGALLQGAIDPTRVMGQVITGMGFIGGGVILSRNGLVKGVTSAAVLWVLASIGAAIGLGFVAIAVYVTLVTLGILLGVERLESTFKAMTRGVHRHSTNVEE